MKKKLQPVITLLQQYMAQDMTVYAGHATLFLLTAFFPLLMWLLVVVNTLPGFTVDSVVELFFRFLPDIPVIRDTIAGLITSMNENSNTFVASLAVITTLVSASSGMAAIQKGLQKLTPGSRRTMLDRLWAVVYTLHTLAYRAIMGWDMKSMPFWRLVKMTISGFSLNQVTPMGLVGGEPYRIMEMKPYIGLEKEDGSMFWGAGTDTDVVKANTKALLSAYNNMIKGGD